MKQNPQDVKVFVSSVLPNIGIDMLRKENFNVIGWKDEIPIPRDMLIKNAKQSNALLCTLTANIDKQFLNECRHLDIISQFGVGTTT